MKSRLRLLGMAMYRLIRSPLPGKLKRQCFRTAFELAIRRAPPAGEQPIRQRICNYDVTASSVPMLRFLFDEIFLRADYLFLATRPDPVILDCGSNIGTSILFFKSIYPAAKIIGFEPSPEAFSLLQQNVQTNSLNDVEIHQLALGASESTISFFVDPRKSASLRASIIESRLSTTDRIDVRQARLSTFVDRDIDFLKLDVEGAEFSVLEDLATSGAIRRIDQMGIEFHHHIVPGRDDFSRLLAVLEVNGFGYLIGAKTPRRGGYPHMDKFQDIAVYAYRKRNTAAATA